MARGKLARRQRSVQDALERWTSTRTLSGRPKRDEIVKAAVALEGPRQPKRGKPREQDESSAIPRRKKEKFKVSRLRVLGRIIVWFLAAFRFYGGNLLDRMRFRSSEKRKAKRLLDVILRAGSTAIKLGQQLSMRVDLLDRSYTDALESLLDKVPPIPAKEARAVIQRAMTGPISETFLRLDEEPFASASISSVFKGVLHDGTQVVVKVRRPGIGELFTADQRALTWVVRLLELFILPPGFGQRVCSEVFTMLLEELDFVKEARFTELFRRDLRKAKYDYADVPVVFFHLSNNEVLVTEFMTGMPLTKVIEAVRQGGADELEAQDIQPRIIARRMLQVIRFSGFEGLFFNADPHPGNIFVRPGNHLVFIDFGSCGSFTKRDLVAWRRLLLAQSNRDVAGMVQATLALLEPLSSVDIDEFTRKLERVFWHDIYAFESKHSKWYERTSANIWYSVLELIRMYRMTPTLNSTRMMRATMISDSLAARLDPQIDHYAEYRRYERQADRRAKKRLFKRFEGVYRRGWALSEQALDIVENTAFRVQRTLDFPLYQLRQIASKASAFFRIVILGAILGSVGVACLVFVWRSLDTLTNPNRSQREPGALGAGLTAVRDAVFGRAYGSDGVHGVLANLERLFTDRWWCQTIVFLVVVTVARRLLLRLDEVERD